MWLALNKRWPVVAVACCSLTREKGESGDWGRGLWEEMAQIGVGLDGHDGRAEAGKG